MASTAGKTVIEDQNQHEAPVRVLSTRPGRFIFTEDGEPDAWIATDLAVPIGGGER